MFLLGLFLFLVMFVSGIYALDNEISKAESGLSTGTVDIEIKEYDQNNKTFDKDGTYVMPGDEIILIPRVINLGMDCYLRAKIDYTINNETFSVIDYIKGDYSSWTKNEEYYYYDSIVSKKESVELFNKVIVPNLPSEYFGKNMVIHIVVEAVQARNFNGNWNDVEIEKSVDRTYDINYDGESTIIYENDTDHHIIMDNDFFNKLGNMLPGDNYKETFKIFNSGTSKREYYLSIDYNNLTDEELKLLQKIILSVRKQNGESLIDINLLDKRKHSLGIYQNGGGDTFIVEISLPKDINNEFSKLFAKITWKFSSNNLEQRDKPEPNIYVIPKTGDNINAYIIVFLMSAIGLLVVLFLWDKENKKKY